MAVTIRDVAREAGVSVATVSHALTGYTDISVKTRQKIQETARRLGYQPNVNGRSRASKKSNRIVLIRKNEKKKTYSVCGSESCGKVTHRDVQTGDMYTLIRILPEDVNMFMHKTL